MKRKILIVNLPSNFKRSPRLIRQIKCLEERFSISLIGYGTINVEGGKVYSLRERRSFFDKVSQAIKLKLSMFQKAYWKKEFLDIADRLVAEKFEIVIANGIDALPLAVKLAKGAKVIFDAWEYYPRHFEDRLWWRFFFRKYRYYLCEKYMKQCDEVITVSDSIAQEYRREFNVQVQVITSAGTFYDLKPTATDDNRIRLIHHGALSPSRRLENMIELMEFLDSRFSLDLVFSTWQKGAQSRYLNKLKRIAAGKRTIRFLDPFSPEEIVPSINRYDIGICFFEGVNFNLKYCLPNKLFEFIQARLAVAIGPSPEMAKIVKKYDCGIVTEDFSVKKIAMQINSLTTKKIMYYKQQSDKAAQDLTSEKRDQEFRNLIDG